MISFVVYTDPKPNQRPRHNRFSNHTYTPKPTKDFQKIVADVAKDYFSSPLTTPVELNMTFYTKRPGTLRKTKPNPKYYRASRPDLDNYVKNILDGLNGIAYKDDSLIVKMTAEKWVCGEDDLRPRIEISIREIDDN